MRILLLSDGIVGHYKQAEGIAAALGRSRSVTVERLELTPPRFLPRKSLPHLARYLPSALFLKLCGITPSRIAKPDLIVSAGGATLGANVALAEVLGVPNIFSGSARGFAPKRITLTLLPYPSARDRAGHLYALKPSTINPDDFPAPAPRQGLRDIRASLLIGGSTAHVRFTAQEWEAIIRFVQTSAQERNIRWQIVTSRRTPDAVYDACNRLELSSNPDVTLIDFRDKGAGSITQAFAADLIFVSGDSLSMISESVAANRRTIVLLPHEITPFRDMEAITSLQNQQRLACVECSDLSLVNLDKTLPEIVPGILNHLDELGNLLIHRLKL